MKIVTETELSVDEMVKLEMVKKMKMENISMLREILVTVPRAFSEIEIIDIEKAIKEKIKKALDEI